MKKTLREDRTAAEWKFVQRKRFIFLLLFAIMDIVVKATAPVAELADAQRSGRCIGNNVQVRILPGA